MPACMQQPRAPTGIGTPLSTGPWSLTGQPCLPVSPTCRPPRRWVCLPVWPRHLLLLSQHLALPMPACRPYLLPCLVVGLLSLVATCSSIFLLSETLPRLVSKQYMALLSADEEAPKLEGELQEGGLEGAGAGPALIWNASTALI